ncbi:transposable element Tcb2 transposase [Trichonephila clavipes]|nr:transposable element Tcb2 transposase [Trichonephila clavipes]
MVEEIESFRTTGLEDIRHRGERLNPVFSLQRHTAATAGVMVWDVIVYNAWSLLALIRGTMTAQVHDILQPYVLPLMQRLLGAIFQQDNARHHSARVSSHKTVSALLLPFLGLPGPQISFQFNIGRCQGSHQELTKETGFNERTLDAEVDDPGLKKERRERLPSRDPPTRCSRERRVGHSQHYRED